MTGGTPEQVTVFLTPHDVEVFTFLQKRYEAILALEKSGALDMKNGKVTLHFDQNGVLRGIEADHWIYKK